jgi:glycosyltransferase involved in cell wall biosynthesis
MAAGSNLAFLGRICPEKRVDRAIELAGQAGVPLKIAVKVDPADREYYQCKIKPLLASPQVEYIGEIAEHEKSEFLGTAYAHIFPIDWREPFGLTMVEAMACGTPTIAFNCGSVPEIINPGVSGLIVDRLAEAVSAVEEAGNLDRLACRHELEKRFTASRMAGDYVTVYEGILSDGSVFAEAQVVASGLAL